MMADESGQPAVVQPAAPSPGEWTPGAIEQDALAACERYLAAFNARDAAQAASFYAIPTMVVRQTGHWVLATRADVESMLAKSLARLEEQGFASTRFGRRTLRAVNENVVLLSADFIRARADGSTIEKVACTYVLSRGPSGWGVATMIAHPPDSVLPGREP